MRDSITLDPVTPPEGATEAELLLCRGLCPWCGERVAFAPSEEFDDSLICRRCGVEFLGTTPDRAGTPPQRTVTAVYVEGDIAMKVAAADSLPAVTARP
jgi:hypothetical protein